LEDLSAFIGSFWSGETGNLGAEERADQGGCWRCGRSAAVGWWITVFGL